MIFGNKIDLTYESLQKSYFDLKFKRFITTSFYVDGGLAAEFWTMTYKVDDVGGSASTELSGSATNIGLAVHIGNQWQWGGFSLGCDWAGYFVVLAKSFTGGSAEGVDPGS
jgi:hypothetical protein